MAQKKKPTKTLMERRTANLRQRAGRMCKGDRKQATGLLFNAIVELWVKADPREAALVLYELSELAKRAGHQKTTLAQIRVLEAKLQNAQSNDEREALVREIRRLTPRAPSPEAKRIQARTWQHQLLALYEHRAKAQTQEEQQQIDERITQLHFEIARHERENKLAAAPA